jgi:hypothetical protein
MTERPRGDHYRLMRALQVHLAADPAAFEDRSVPSEFLRTIAADADIRCGRAPLYVDGAAICWMCGHPWPCPTLESEAITRDLVRHGVPWSIARGPNLHHARDISDATFLAAVEAAAMPWGKTMVGDLCVELERRGFRAAPTFSGHRQPAVPGKIVRAKAARLIGRHLLDGCPCGCRGDFELTPTGREYLTSNHKALTGESE